MKLERELQVATSLALQAGEVLWRHQSRQPKVEYRAKGEPVTLADIQADSIIRAGLNTAFPNDAVFSEESADSHARLSCTRVWIVDPLDSTNNFVELGNEYCVSIGLSIQGQAVLGVIYNPARDELFTGYCGRGVLLNGSPVKASEVREVEKARISVSRKEWRRGIVMLSTTLRIEPLSSMAYKLARVAAGMDDGVFSLTPRKEWGTCAGVALVEAAGGRTSLLDGRRIAFNRFNLRQPLGMVAAGSQLHPLLVERVRDLSPAIWDECGGICRKVDDPWTAIPTEQEDPTNEGRDGL
ncbi:MAG: 3'(2'),5'-bisphosphate nucleotidase CysQ [Acidobacteriia bacterium]|nr:3'(2'),5'-bisphosphate nucleotidase CysQ [Terriglobia bacterium]